MKFIFRVAFIPCFLLLLFSACGSQNGNQTQTAALTETQSRWWGEEETYSSIAISENQTDPYSFIIKEKYEDLALATKDGYDYMSKLFLFGRYDIDGDGVEELLLTNYYPQWGGIEYGMDTDNVPIFEWLYTIRNEKAKQVKLDSDWQWNYFAESMGGRDVLTNGIIRLCGGSPDYTSYAYYIYKDGKLTFLKTLKNYADGTRWLETDDPGPSGRIAITEEEFNRMRAEIEGDAQVVQIDWKPLESYGRE